MGRARGLALFWEIAKSKVAENSDRALCAANEKTNENQAQD